MKTIRDAKDIKLMKPTSAMMSARKGAWGGVFSLIVPALILTGGATVGYGAYQYFWGDDSGDSGDQQLEFTSSKQTTPDGQEVETPNDMDASQCGDGRKTVFDAVAVNPLDEDGTPTYQNVTLHLQDKEGTGALRTYSTTGTSEFAEESLQLSCPQEYTVYVPAKQNKTASMKMPLTADRAVENIQPEIPSTDFLKIKGYDELNRGFVHDTNDADATDYEDMENGPVTFQSTTNDSAYDMGVGDDLDMTFRVKTDSQKQWGDLGNYIVVDADTSDFREPSLYMGGQPLEEVGKAGLPHVDDQGYVSGYEYVFKVPDDISDEAKEIRLVTGSKDSIDPDVDIKMRFLVNSISMDGTSARESIFKSDGSEVAYSSAQTVTIDIA